MKKLRPTVKVVTPWVLLVAALIGAPPLVGADNTVAYELALETPTEVIPQSNQAERSPGDLSKTTPESARQLVVKHKRPVAGSMPRQRQRISSPTPEQLLVIAYDSQGTELYRTAIHDPRVIRAEFLGDDQQNSGPTRVINADAPLNFTLPDDPSIFRIDILQPDWQDGRMQLRAVGSVMLQ